MIYVLVKVFQGLINEVKLYYDEVEALKALDAYVKEMDPEDDDAAMYGPGGEVANAKTFLDDEDRYDASVLDKLLKSAGSLKPVYAIGNPNHFLGFMIASFDDPMGYTDPIEAVSDIGVLRKIYGKQLKLYRLIPVTEALVKKGDVDKYNAENEIEDFDSSLAGEYMNYIEHKPK